MTRGRKMSLQPQALELVGFIDQGLTEPSFLASAFRSAEGNLYISNTANNKISISSFSMADVRNSDLVPAPTSLRRVYSLGDENIFSFKDINGTIDSGTRACLVGRLRKKFRGLTRYPFSQLEVAGFINQPRLLALAIRNSLALETAAYAGSTRAALVEMTREFDLDETYACRLLALDYAGALISYYRLFRRLINVSDPVMRRRLSYRFRSATDNIVPFLLDSSIFEIILGGTFAAQQLNLPSADFDATPREFHIETTLRRLGVSAATAERYACRVRYETRHQESPPSVREAVLACDSIKNLQFRRDYTEFATGRLDKKRRKRQLDAEFMDLTFGLTLSLSHELRILNIDSESYAKIQANIGNSVCKLARLSSK